MIGEVTEKTKYFKHDDYLDVSNDVIFSKVTYPELYNTLHSANFTGDEYAQQLVDPLASANDESGYSVAIDKDTIVVGAHKEDTISSASGSVYVYVKEGDHWRMQQKISNPSPGIDFHFGASVDIKDDRLVVGAPGDDCGSTAGAGSIHTYTRTDGLWTFEQTIDNPSPTADKNFGFSVSLFDDTIVLGTPLSFGLGSGSFSVYRLSTTWTLEQKINNPSVDFTEFGYSVSIYRDTVAIGAPNGGGTGRVHIYTRSGTVWSSEQVIDTSETSDGFGNSVSLYEDTLAIGAYATQISFSDNAGTAYIYNRVGSTWSLTQTMEPLDNIGTGYFGYSVNIHDTSLIIGFPGLSIAPEGGAYIYYFDEVDQDWVLGPVIRNSITPNSDDFGHAVTIYDDIAAIGAPYSNAKATDSGKVDVFQIEKYDFGGIDLSQSLLNPSPEANSEFANSVSIDGDTFVVGSYRKTVGSIYRAGSICVYRKISGTWTLEQEIDNSTPTANAEFGHSVSIHGDTIAVGVPGSNVGDTASGIVRIYTRSGSVWSIEDTINNPNPASNDYFGDQVSLDKDTVAISAPYDDVTASASGSVYVYTRSGTSWGLEQTIANPDPVLDDNFGSSISVQENMLAIGVPFKDASQTNTGKTFIYYRSGATWTLDKTIVSPDGAQNDYFGTSVSVFDDEVAIGSPGADKIYTYIRYGTGSWSSGSSVSDPGGLLGINFGVSASLHKNTVIIGDDKYGFVGPTQEQGIAYAYTRPYKGATWVQGESLINPNASSYNYFGSKVEIDNDNVIIGSPVDDYAYVYTSPVIGTEKISAVVSSNPTTKFFIQAR